MSLFEYYQHKELRSLEVFTCIRHPLSRMVPLYFSPHRHVKYDEKEKLFSMPSEVEFDINEFERLVQKSRPMIEMLSVKSE